MTGNILIDLAISLAGIGFLVALARVLFPSRERTLTQAEAAERLAFDEPDFVAATWVIDGVGGAALAESDAGECALLLRVGEDLTTRRFQKDQADIEREDGVLVIKLDDHSVPVVRIRSA